MIQYAFRSGTVVLGLLLVGCLKALAASPPVASERPNLAFTLLDNLGKEWFGAYGSQENAAAGPLGRGGRADRELLCAAGLRAQ